MDFSYLDSDTDNTDVADISEEIKFFDSNRPIISVSATGTILNPSLCLIPQGITESTRIGRKCTLRSISIQGRFRLPNATAANSTTDRVRLIIYVDKQTNGVAAGVTDILTTAAINSYYNLSNQGRFVILCDKSVAVSATCESGDGTTNTYGEVHINLYEYYELNLPIEYSSVSGAITEITSNNVGVIAITDQGLITVIYTGRTRYTDD